VYNISNIDKISRLPAITIDYRLLSVLERGYEAWYDRRIGGCRILARPIDIEEAQRDRL
jgi:hypothetical protein